ncbi:MAG: elongation factor P [Clostridiales bacterium]|jgi:elongation factor P|nr:elongation factor P [Clostridiales bacterium]
MLSAGEFRNGVTVEIDGDVCQIIEFQHVKPGKGAAFVRTKIRNVMTGSVVERTFRPTDKMPRAHIDRADMQYLYQDGDLYNFMNVENYEQIAVSAADVGDTLKFVKENETVKVLSWNGKVFGIEPPLTVELIITDTEPGFAGNTATGATKPATVETGAAIQVPLFITAGERVKIDTRTGEYIGRAN